MHSLLLHSSESDASTKSKSFSLLASLPGHWQEGDSPFHQIQATLGYAIKCSSLYKEAHQKEVPKKIECLHKDRRIKLDHVATRHKVTITHIGSKEVQANTINEGYE